MVKICDAFLLSLPSGLLLLYCRIILHFIELADWTKEDKKEHGISTQFPLGLLSHCASTAPPYFQSVFLWPENLGTDSGLLPYKTVSLLSYSEL